MAPWDADRRPSVKQVEEAKQAQGKALRKASREGDNVAVRRLLEQKADVRWARAPPVCSFRACTARASTVLVLSQVNALGNKGFSALMNAAYNGQESTARMLVDAGANLEAKTDAGCTALQGASRNDHLGTATLLIERGCRLDAITNDGMTALDIARSFERPALVALLEAAEARERVGPAAAGSSRAERN